MKTVIVEEAARKEIAEWAEFFEAELSEESIKSLLPSVMRGRVIFDQESEQFVISLRSKIDLQNGKSVTELTMREPEAGEIQSSMRGKSDMDTAMSLYATLSSQPLGVIQRLKQRDMIALSGVFSFFG